MQKLHIIFWVIQKLPPISKYQNFLTFPENNFFEYFSKLKTMKW